MLTLGVIRVKTEFCKQYDQKCKANSVASVKFNTLFMVGPPLQVNANLQNSWVYQTVGSKKT